MLFNFNGFVFIGAISKGSFEKLNTQNSKDQQEEHDNEKYIHQGWNGFKQSIYHGFNAYIVIKD